MKRIGIKNNNIFLGSTEFSLIAILVILFVFFSVSTNSFFSVYNLTNILKQASIIGIIAVASTLVIISGGIDLSVGAVTGIGSLVVALMMQRLGSPIWLTIVAAIIAGAICGLYNGIIILLLQL
jgi:ribose/xylose/arabinose/galactoside ABC-type transport system permease subunit